jgi:glycosyltransferase involved in cell wall biosynthesis
VNTLVVQRLEDLATTEWPRRMDPDRRRILFLNSHVLGFRTWAGQLEAATASCDFVEAVHVHLPPPKMLKALGAWIPPTKGGFWHAWRHWMLWKRYVQAWLARIPLTEFDAIHVTNQYCAAAFVAQPDHVRRRTVVCVDATSALEHREFGYSIVDRVPLILAERRLMSSIAGASGMTRWACESLVADCRVDRRNVALARLGVPTPAGVATPRHAPARGAGSIDIAFVGNHWERKGGDRLLRWHQSRWSSRARLHVIGSSAPDLSGARNVVVHGAVPHERLVHDTLPAMDILVHPSHEDTLAWVLLEAQAAGVPVVASRIAGIATDVVEHGRTGFLCARDADDEFMQATERLLDDSALRAEMSLRCIERMGTEWDPASCADRYFREILRLTAPTTVVP